MKTEWRIHPEFGYLLKLHLPSGNAPILGMTSNVDAIKRQVSLAVCVDSIPSRNRKKRPCEMHGIRERRQEAKRDDEMREQIWGESTPCDEPAKVI